MSSNLAIASVTATMKYVLQNPLSRDNIDAVVPGLLISAVPPHKVKDEEPHLNLFFYRATANTGWAQHGLPSRNDAGDRVSNPYLALDLYYLISAHGVADYQGEILLGYVMQAFHETPVLTRPTIQTALTSTSLETAETPASIVAAFAASELAEQVEQIKIIPYYPLPEELSNVWSTTHISYVPTAHYKISVALIESKRPARSAPPVRAYNLYALPFKHPHIRDAISEAGIGHPIHSRSRIILRGSALRGDDTRVLIGGGELSGTDLVVTNEQITLTLPSSLSAGIVGASAIHKLNIGTPPTPHEGLSSNTVAFIMQPRIALNAAGSAYAIDVLAESAPDPRRLRVTIDPAVGARQRAILLLNEIDAPAGRAPHLYTFEASARSATAAPTNQLTFPIPGAVAGRYLVRVQIDGAQSPLDYVVDAGYRSPRVEL